MSSIPVNGNDVSALPYKSYRLLKRTQVEQVTSLSRTQIYRLMAAGQFPASISLGGRSRVAWVEAEVHAWVEGRIAASRPNHGS
jgi:prophage regulatory protein